MNPDETRADEQRAAWIQHGLGELIMWINHSIEKVDFIEAEQIEGRIRYIEKSELIFALAVVMNRLAQIDKRKVGNLNINNDLVPWIAARTGWPHSIAEVFWGCLRSPVVHMGQSFAMADYGYKTTTGLPILVSLDISPRRQRGSYSGVGFPPGPATDDSRGPGWSALHYPSLGDPPYDAWSGEHIGVTFDIYGVLDVARSMIRDVAQGIRNATPAELDKLRDLNRRLPFLYYETLDPLLDV